MNETPTWLAELKLKAANLRHELELLDAAINFTENVLNKRTIQRTLDGSVAVPPKPKKLKFEEKDVFVPGKPIGPKGEYERHIEPAEFMRKICKDIMIALIDEYQREGEVPILFITERLGANRNNGYYTAKALVKQNPQLAYVEYNKWKQREGTLVGLMSRSRAHQLKLRIIEQDIKEEPEHGTRNETADS